MPCASMACTRRTETNDGVTERIAIFGRTVCKVLDKSIASLVLLYSGHHACGPNMRSNKHEVSSHSHLGRSHQRRHYMYNSGHCASRIYSYRLGTSTWLRPERAGRNTTVINKYIPSCSRKMRSPVILLYITVMSFREGLDSGDSSVTPIQPSLQRQRTVRGADVYPHDGCLQTEVHSCATRLVHASTNSTRREHHGGSGFSPTRDYHRDT